MAIKTEFYYSQLNSPKAKELYRNILQSVRERKTSAKVEDAHMKFDETALVIRAIEFDHPELFYISFHEKECEMVTYKNGAMEVKFCYLYSPEKEKKIIRQTQEFVQYLTSHIPWTVKGSKYRTALWLHDTLIRNLSYDHEASDKGSDEKPDAYTIVGGMTGKSAVCAGITKLYQMLCEHEDIWCIYVSGNSLKKTEDGKKKLGENHAWNMIHLGQYYAYVDVTWDLIDDKEHVHFTHRYFGMSDSQCGQKHARKNKDFADCLPVCVENNPLNYYIQSGTYMKSFQQLEQLIKKMAKEGKTNISFQIAPQGRDCRVIAERTILWMGEWIKRYLKRSAEEVMSWTWWSDEDMMTFEYHVSYD